jgi:uncharacterized Zn finger protein
MTYNFTITCDSCGSTDVDLNATVDEEVFIVCYGCGNTEKK